jgi:phenylacetate-CoA ligase
VPSDRRRQLSLTIDFFQHGMATLAAPGQRVLILLPGAAPGSVGDLLCSALWRMNVQGVLMAPTSLVGPN